MSEEILSRMCKMAAKKAAQTSQSKAKTFGRTVAPLRVPGHVGLELEIEGVGLPRNIEFEAPETGVRWANHEDGSLRGENNEYVTDGPILVSEVEPMVGALFSAFDEAKTQLKLSNRCSTHVHVNCSTLSVKTITAYLALFTIMEEALANWCGADRVSNPFCLRAVDTTETIDKWYVYVEEQGRAEFDKNDKYSGLNLRPLWNMGSVEFRHLRGAESADLVYKWVRMLWALREEARTGYKNPSALAQMVSARSVRGVVDEFVHRMGVADVWEEVCAVPANQGQIDRMLRRGFLLVQPLVLGLPWDLAPANEDAADIPVPPKDAKRRLKKAVADPFEQQLEEMARVRAAPLPRRGLDGLRVEPAGWGVPAPRPDENIAQPIWAEPVADEQPVDEGED